MSQEIATEVKEENKMGTMPVGKLIFNMSLPMMVSMLVQALYNIVDSVFVAQLSENALTAVSMAFPVQNLISSTIRSTVCAAPVVCSVESTRCPVSAASSAVEIVS